MENTILNRYVLVKISKYCHTMKYEKKRLDCNVYLTLLYFYKGYGYCNYNFVQVVKVKKYVYSSFWNV